MITTMTGYESAMGYTVFDLNQKTQKVYNIGSEGSSTGLIRYDTGLMEINNFIRDKDDKDGAYKTMYLDFKTGKLTEISLQDPGDTGFISMPYYCYVGQNYSAFITFKQSTSDYTKNMIFLNRLHLGTMQIEPSIITVQGAETYILGV